jgi:hypothetical protein
MALYRSPLGRQYGGLYGDLASPEVLRRYDHLTLAQLTRGALGLLTQPGR